MENAIKILILRGHWCCTYRIIRALGTQVQVHSPVLALNEIRAELHDGNNSGEDEVLAVFLRTLTEEVWEEER